MNKNKKGFTLMELLVVILIVAVVSVSATVSFSNIDDSTKQKELENKYAEIQRAAGLYLDLHNSYLNTFISEKQMYVKLYVLAEENYVSSDLENPVTGDSINPDYYVKLYVPSDNSKVESCILSIDSSGNEKCIADRKGKPCNCCSASCN